MTDITTAQARRQLADLLSRVAYGKERIVVTRHGKGLAAIVPLEDLDLIERLRSLLSRGEARAGLEDSEEGMVSWESLKSDLGF